MQVHEEIQKCINKEDGATYPTTKSLHDKIQQIPGMKKFSPRTTHRILLAMGFKWLPSHQINLGLLMEDDFIVNRQINFCQEYWRLKMEGYTMYPLDETFVNANYIPKRIIHDTTIKSARQVSIYLQCCQLCFFLILILRSNFRTWL